MRRPGVGLRVPRVGLALVVSAFLAAGCSSEPTSLSGNGDAHLALQLHAPASTEVVVLHVSGPGLDSTLVFNFPVSAGSATGSVSIPAGSARRIVAQAYDSAGINTHAGDTTVMLVPGTNPALQLRLAALTGGLPITISFGAFALTLTPGDTSVMVGDTVRFRANIIDAYGRPVTASPLWGTSNLALASVDSLGLATGRLPGSVSVAATYGGAVAFRALTVNGSAASVGNVDAGDQHACVVTGGRLYCWGDNTYGQLGDGTTEPRPGPVAVALGAGVRAVSAGGAHTCALAADSTAWCWGENGSGQLGDGSTVRRLVPVPVAGGQRFVATSAGLSHTCAIKAGGAPYCWGSGFGASPVQVATNRLALQLEAGDAHTCMLAADLTAWCWGDNSVGQLGDGTTTSQATPVQVVTPAGQWLTVSAGGAHSCGILTTGALMCWGLNGSGQLGVGASTGPSLVPVAVNTAQRFAGVSAGNTHTCALDLSGAAWCWGDGRSGQVGDGAEATRVSPAAVVGAPPLRQITAGLAFSCGLAASGTPVCWGDNAVGQVGDGTALALWSPEPVGGGVRFARVAVGLRHACGVTDLGAAFCWGGNDFGQLGTGSSTLQASPAAVAGSRTFRSVAAGAAHSCGILADSTAWCWGDNRAGQLGNGTLTSSLTPTQVPGLHGVVDVQTNLEITCALQADSTAWCWGGSFAPAGNTPGQSGYAIGNVRLAVGGYHVCFLRPGVVGVGCRGDNSYNQLGSGGVFSVLSAGTRHTCGLASGSTWCWGDNQAGQLGDGTRLARTSPVLTNGSRLFFALAAGGDFTCGLTPAGAVSCWGANDLGQLGLGTRTPQLEPTALVPGSYVSLAAGSAAACATDAAATWCWGDNRYGQLGRGTRSIVTRPVTVRFAPVASRTIAGATQALPPGAADFAARRCSLGIPFVDVSAPRACR